MLKTYSLSLNGLIEFNFYFELSDTLLQDTEAYALFILPDGRQQKQYVKDAVHKNGKYGFTCGLYAKEMTQDVFIQIINGKGEHTQKYAYAIEDYVNYVLNSSSAAYLNVKPLIKAMMNYGGYAQDECSAYVDDKAYKNVKAEFEDEMNLIDASDFSEYAFKQISTDYNISPRSLSLILEEATTLRFYIKVADESKVSSAIVKVNGITTSLGKNNKGYYVDVPAIKSNKLDEIYTIQINGLEVQCSALSYMYSFLRYSTNEVDTAVAKALYIYYLRSKAYFGE